MTDKKYRDSKDKYLKEKVDTFVLRVPKGKKDEIAEHAKELGLSLNAYVTALIYDDMDGGASVAPKPTAKKRTVKKAAENPTTQSNPKDKEEETAAVPAAEINIADPAEEIKKKKMPSFLL